MSDHSPDAGKKVYIVHGTTGEYSDRWEWMVAAYTDEAKAVAHAEAAKKFYMERDLFRRRHRYDYPRNPFDPDMAIDYTGTDWIVQAVELRDDLPEVKND